MPTDLNTNPSQERLEASAGTGEALTVIYHAGSHPGHKRRIVVLSIDDDTMTVRTIPGHEAKTYFASQTQICDDDYPAPWAPEAVRVKWTKIDPISHFSGWHFGIGKVCYAALGVTRREYVNREKTKAAKDAGAKHSIKEMAYAISDPLQLDFHDGDIFRCFSGERPQIEDCLQIVCLFTQQNPRVDMLEVHRIFAGRRNAYILPRTSLVAWLRDGEPDAQVVRISRQKSRREVMRPYITETNE